MQLIPAMDLINGKCVRLYQGEWEQQEYFEQSPLEWALKNETSGVSRLHMVDLDGAFTGNSQNKEILREVRKAVTIPIQIGGGIRTVAQAEQLINEGFDVILGTMLYKDPVSTVKLIQKYPDQLVASVDCKNGNVTLEGWTLGTDVSGVEFVQYLTRIGFKRIVYTDISKDGTLTGSNLKELSELMALKEAHPFSLIASGGIGCLGDLKSLKALGVEEAIVGKALLSGAFTLERALEVCYAD